MTLTQTASHPAGRMQPTDNRLPMASLLLGGVAISGSPIFVRLSEVGPLSTAFWRVALALIPLGLVFIFRRDKGVAPQTMRDRVMLTLPGIMLAANLACWHLSIHMTSVANSTLLANLAPVFVTIFGWALFRLPITRAFVLGLMTAAVGILVLKGGPAAIGGGALKGDLVATISAMFYAGYILSVGRLRSRFDTLRIMVWGSASAAICVLPAALMFENTLFPTTLPGWATVFGIAFISHASGQVLITYALAFLPAAFSSLTLLLQPVGASILAWLVLNEPIGLMQAAGGLIVLAGIAIARRG